MFPPFMYRSSATDGRLPAHFQPNHEGTMLFDMPDNWVGRLLPAEPLTRGASVGGTHCSAGAGLLTWQVSTHWVGGRKTDGQGW
jgi:hypothetical protein